MAKKSLGRSERFTNFTEKRRARVPKAMPGDRRRMADSFPLVRAPFPSADALHCGSSILPGSAPLPVQPREHVRLAEAPILPKTKARNAVHAALARALVHPGQRDAQQFGHSFNREERACVCHSLDGLARQRTAVWFGLQTHHVPSTSRDQRAGVGGTPRSLLWLENPQRGGLLQPSPGCCPRPKSNVAPCASSVLLNTSLHHRGERNAGEKVICLFHATFTVPRSFSRRCARTAGEGVSYL
jgi:hypothetical protein